MILAPILISFFRMVVSDQSPTVSGTANVAYWHWHIGDIRISIRNVR